MSRVPRRCLPPRKIGLVVFRGRLQVNLSLKLGFLKNHSCFLWVSHLLLGQVVWGLCSTVRVRTDCGLAFSKALASCLTCIVKWKGPPLLREFSGAVCWEGFWEAVRAFLGPQVL